MASPLPSYAHLSAFLALGVTVLSALLGVVGPWQPASVVLGAIAIPVMIYALLAGSGVAVGVVAGIEVVRIGVQAISGNPRPGPVASVVMLVAMVESASASIEVRVMPVDPKAASVRVMVVSAVAGVAVALVLGSVRVTAVGDVWAPVVAMGAGATLAVLLLSLVRRRPE